MSDSRPDLVIYGSPISPFVRKVAGVCIAKGVGYEIEAVNVFDPPAWFRAISPMKRIPVLRDRSVAEEGVAGTIADSSAICAYIEKKHPAPALYPDAPLALGEALFIEEYADTALAMAAGMGMFRPIFFAIAKGEAPALDKAREAWSAQVCPILDVLEARLAGRVFFAGEALSIADITVACVLGQIALVARLDLAPWPGLAAHYAALQALPAIAGPFEAAQKAVRQSLPTPFELT